MQKRDNLVLTPKLRKYHTKPHGLRKSHLFKEDSGLSCGEGGQPAPRPADGAADPRRASVSAHLPFKAGTMGSPQAGRLGLRRQGDSDAAGRATRRRQGLSSRMPLHAELSTAVRGRVTHMLIKVRPVDLTIGPRPSWAPVEECFPGKRRETLDRAATRERRPKRHQRGLNGDGRGPAGRRRPDRQTSTLRDTSCCCDSDMSQDRPHSSNSITETEKLRRAASRCRRSARERAVGRGGAEGGVVLGRGDPPHGSGGQ